MSITQHGGGPPEGLAAAAIDRHRENTAGVSIRRRRSKVHVEPRKQGAGGNRCPGPSLPRHASMLRRNQFPQDTGSVHCVDLPNGGVPDCFTRNVAVRTKRRVRRGGLQPRDAPDRARSRRHRWASLGSVSRETFPCSSAETRRTSGGQRRALFCMCAGAPPVTSVSQQTCLWATYCEGSVCTTGLSSR